MLLLCYCAQVLRAAWVGVVQVVYSLTMQCRPMRRRCSPSLRGVQQQQQCMHPLRA
jgi:hypothetical protein